MIKTPSFYFMIVYMIRHIYFILTVMKQSRFIDTTWILVNSIGTVPRLMIIKRIFLVLVSRHNQSLLITMSGIVRLCGEIRCVKLQGFKRKLEHFITRMNLQSDFVSIPTVVKYLYEYTNRIEHRFDESRTQISLCQSIKIEAHDRRADHKLSARNRFKCFVHHCCESAINFRNRNWSNIYTHFTFTVLGFTWIVPGWIIIACYFISRESAIT